ncbi:6613_t:CDS:1 [Funneliformis caledonium]|uniref:6613_t:CDS:1 n=1 Tax=Funneliformis caledonium TaxID=1117310 RepID=A0A9N9HS98_9GLOM|nr:6613_t:CDS:1 [Funneliformis caledonium]
MTLQQKVQSIYQALLRACKIRDRVLILVNAYYLGQLLETESTNPSERIMLQNMMTIYYRLGVTRIYYLFEFLEVEQIQHTQIINFATIRQLKACEFRALINYTHQLSIRNEEETDEFLLEFKN